MLDPLQEDHVVEELMLKCGDIDLVRGGSYGEINLDFVQKEALYRKFAHAQGKCIGCGAKNHYISKCKDQLCIRCGKTGHFWYRCDDKSVTCPWYLTQQK